MFGTLPIACDAQAEACFARKVYLGSGCVIICYPMPMMHSLRPFHVWYVQMLALFSLKPRDESCTPFVCISEGTTANPTTYASKDVPTS